jgi:FkbM family methyltransferase
MVHGLKNRISNLVRDLGWWGMMMHGVGCVFLKRGIRVRLRTSCARYPVAARAGTSDIAVFRQVFRDREYGSFDDLTDVTTIIDCGANIGFTSVFFLNQFPNSTVLAIEPDPKNFELLQLNLAPYGARAKALCTGIWSKNVGLNVLAAPVERGRIEAWSIQVTEVPPGEKADLQATTIPDLMQMVKGGNVSILKIDIEGAEVQVFTQDCSAWLPMVENLAIELHGDKARDIFLAAVKDQGFSFSYSGDLTICRRVPLPEPAAVH